MKLLPLAEILRIFSRCVSLYLSLHLPWKITAVTLWDK